MSSVLTYIRVQRDVVQRVQRSGVQCSLCVLPLKESITGRRVYFFTLSFALSLPGHLTFPSPSYRHSPAISPPTHHILSILSCGNLHTLHLIVCPCTVMTPCLLLPRIVRVVAAVSETAHCSNHSTSNYSMHNFLQMTASLYVCYSYNAVPLKDNDNYVADYPRYVIVRTMF